MVKIIKEDLDIEEALKKKLEFICSFCNTDCEIKKDSIRKIERTNLSYVEPHRIIIKGITFLAFNKALINRGLKKNGIFHSDRGSQYISNDYESLLSSLEIRHSYSKKGYTYDNASMESVGAILKKEEVNVNKYKTFEEAKSAIFEFIEAWYNNQKNSIGTIKIYSNIL